MNRLCVAALIAISASAAPALRGFEAPSGSRLPEANIRAAAKYSRASGGHALFVRQWGRTVHESYADGFSLTAGHQIFSITKSLAAISCFIAAEEGWLTLDEPIYKTITEWKSDPTKRRVTIRMLLNLNSGIDPGFPSLYARGLEDKNSRAIRLRLLTSPGARFDYGPANYEVLEVLLSRKLGARGTSLAAFLERRVLAPIGASVSIDWRADANGNRYLSTGARMSVRGVAALADAVLSRGRVGGRKIFAAENIADAAQGSSASRMYGLSFWTNQNATRPKARTLSVEGTLGKEFPPAFWQDACLSKNAPSDLLAMIGSGGQRAYIVPSHGLMVVRFGSGSRFDDAEFLDLFFGASAQAASGRAR